MNVSFRNPGPFAAIGFLAAFAMAVIISVAINADAGWVYGENTLSDLGVSDVELVSNLFNYGCMIVGILMIVFGLGKAATETGYNRGSGCLVAIAAVFMVIIGFIHSDFGNGNTHNIVAILTYLFLIAAIGLSAVGDWKVGGKLNAALSSILIVVILGCLAGMNIEKLEVIVTACAIIWVMGTSAKMAFDSRKA